MRQWVTSAMVLQTIANDEICVILTIRRGP
jgi:hypothetical protein